MLKFFPPLLINNRQMRLLAIRLTRIFNMLLIYNDVSEACISHKIIISPRWEVLRRAIPVLRSDYG